MPHERTLRDKARAAVRSGKLPGRRPARTWCGRGVGAMRSICELPGTRDQMEFGIRFAHDGDISGRDTLHVHIRAIAAWVFERRGNR